MIISDNPNITIHYHWDGHIASIEYNTPSQQPDAKENQ